MRLFMALDLGKTAREEAVRLQEKAKRAILHGVKWVLPANMHITLVFLGEVSPAVLPAINREVALALANKKTFSLGLQGVGLFPGTQNPRVLWIGVGKGLDSVVDLCFSLENSLKKFITFKDRRKKTPHLTLGRIKGKLDGQFLQDFVHEYRHQEFAPFKVKGVILYQSFLGPEGPRYRALQFFKLK